MADNIPVLSGFTKEVYVTNKLGIGRPFLVKPNTDYSGMFRAWDMVDQDFITLDGSMLHVHS